MGSGQQQEVQFCSFLKAELDNVLLSIVAEYRRVAHASEQPIADASHNPVQEVINLPRHAVGQDSCTTVSSIRSTPVIVSPVVSRIQSKADELILDNVSEVSRTSELYESFSKVPPEPRQFLDEMPAMTSEDEGDHQAGEAKFCTLEVWSKKCKLDRRSNTSFFSAVSKTSDLESQELEHLMELDRAKYNHLAQLIQFLDGLVLQPNSSIAVYWAFAGLTLIIWDFIAVPLFFFGPDAYPFIRAVSWPGLLYWSMDATTSFFLGYVSAEGTVVISFIGIGKRYLRTRFLFDICLLFCMWIAFALDVSQDSSDLTTLRVIGSLRGAELLRIHRLVHLSRRCENMFVHIRSESSRLVASLCIALCIFLLLIHVMGCIWHGLSDGEWTRNWSVPNAYIHSVHVVLSAFVGEHVVMPETHGQRYFFVFLLLFGFVVCSAFVGTLTTTMTRLQHLARQRHALFATLARYLVEKSISKDLAVRINRNAHFALAEKKLRIQEEDVELVQLISENLRAELHYEIHSPALTEYPFLRLFNMARPTAIQTICHTAISVTKLSEGDAVFSEMEVPTKPKMFFCVFGALRYYSVHYKVDEVVHVKHWVAEPVLWTTWTHRGTLRARHDSQVLRVDATLFAEIMMAVQMTAVMRGYAHRFVKILNDSETSEAITDLGPPIEDSRRISMETFQEGDKNFRIPPGWRFGLSDSRRRSSVTSIASMFSSRPSIVSTGDQDLVIPSRSSSRERTSFVQVKPCS